MELTRPFQKGTVRAAGSFQCKRMALRAQNSKILSKVLRALDRTTASTNPKRHTETDMVMGVARTSAMQSITADQKDWIS